jgi:hypothetical protein
LLIVHARSRKGLLAHLESKTSGAFKKISVEWKYGGYPGNSLVSFELFAQGDKTKLVLTHEGIETFNPERYPELAKQNFVAGWTQFMDKELKEFLER